jgi:MFS transporter, MHS family, proline/betaine transporter
MDQRTFPARIEKDTRRLSLASADHSKRRIILAAIVGNVMEWYDFSVYGFLAVIIGRHYFPDSDPSISLMAAFGAFAVGFVTRPVGGLIIGRIGDLFGRRRALIISMLAMAAPTMLLGLLPTYAAIGIAAPVAVVILRLVQGLSAGGECSSTMVFLAENAAPGRRGITAVWGVWGGIAGTLLGSGVSALIASLMSEAQLSNFGWRLPFLFGGAVAITGYMIRRGLHADTPAGASQQPVRDTFGRHRWDVAKVALLNVSLAVTFYTVFVYSVTYIRKIDHLPTSTALELTTAGMAMLLVTMPAGAWLSDRLGRKPLIIASSAILTFGAVPIFHLLHSDVVASILLGIAIAVIAIGLLNGSLIAATVELVPRAVRCTGVSVAFNAAIALTGGTTPLVAAWLIRATGNPIAPAYWVAAGCAITLFTALFLIPETRDRALDEKVQVATARTR